MSHHYRSHDPMIDHLVAQTCWSFEDPSEEDKRQALAEAYEEDEDEYRLTQEEEALAWEETHEFDRPSIVCPWDLPGSDRPLTPDRQVIFTPDHSTADQASA